MKLHRGSRTHNWVNRVHLWVLARKRVSLLAGSANRAAASQKRVFAQSHVFYVLEGTLLAQVSFTATHWWVEVVKNCAAERQSTAQTVILRSTLWKQKAERIHLGCRETDSKISTQFATIRNLQNLIPLGIRFWRLQVLRIYGWND
jgi:hypothetical protein